MFFPTNITDAFIVFVVSLIVVFDVIAFMLRGEEQTISVRLYKAALQYPVISFAMGFVMGHLFWVQHV